MNASKKKFQGGKANGQAYLGQETNVNGQVFPAGYYPFPFWNYPICERDGTVLSVPATTIDGDVASKPDNGVSSDYTGDFNYGSHPLDTLPTHASAPVPTPVHDPDPAPIPSYDGGNSGGYDSGASADTSSGGSDGGGSSSD